MTDENLPYCLSESGGAPQTANVEVVNTPMWRKQRKEPLYQIHYTLFPRECGGFFCNKIVENVSEHVEAGGAGFKKWIFLGSLSSSDRAG
jgi:hypothetical protein